MSVSESHLARAVRAGAEWLLELIAGALDKVAALTLAAGLVGSSGCTMDDEEEIVPPAPIAASNAASNVGSRVAPTPDAPTKRESVPPKPLGQFEITFYYVIGEEEITRKPPVNDNHSAELADISEQEVSTLYDSACKPIAQVDPDFATALAIQGTGKLKDGRVLNIWGSCSCPHSPCFQVTANKWGTAGSGKPLQPFRTVAVDPKVIKIGSLLYVPLLEGRTMPGRAPWGGYVHDGCVVADDTGGGIDGHQLDLFVGRRAYFLGLSGQEGSHSWARHADVFDGSEICTRKGREVIRRAGAI
jgi:3D (Asp-Asp-Asp) domain-containing protein